MAVVREAVERVLADVACPGGGTLISRDLVRALQIDGGAVRFVLEAASPEEARAALEAINPQNRLIQPAEVTAAALWLCGQGSEGINGQAITIAGGEL